MLIMRAYDGIFVQKWLKIVKNGLLCLLFTKNVLPLSSLKALVPWMSGLVSGLQNRVRRFESARYLKESRRTGTLLYFI